MLQILLLTATLMTFNVSTAPVPAPAPDYLYKVTLVRATPGKLLDLLDFQKAHLETGYAASGDESPFWMRHSQGDQWDLMFILPMESYEAYYHTERLAQRQTHENDLWQKTWLELVAWQEDLFVYGPPLDEMRQAFSDAGYFHVEMFKALPGKHDELYQQREMENAYLAGVNRPQNMIFVRDQGGATDVFTLGFYRDIKHFAESADIPLDEEDRAAKAAGFEGVTAISPYLRSLIQEHHDTLAGAIR